MTTVQRPQVLPRDEVRERELGFEVLIQGCTRKLDQDTLTPCDTVTLNEWREVLEVTVEEFGEARRELRVLGATIFGSAPITIRHEDQMVPGYALTYGYEVS